MGNSADRAWQLSQLVEGVSTAFNPSHGSLSCVETNCVSFASAQARKLNRSVCFSFPHEVGYFVGTPFIAGHCVSKQIGRRDAACQGCSRRVSQPAVLSALLVIQLSGVVFHLRILPESTKRSAAAISRPQRSFISFYGALRNILFSADLSAVFPKIASDFVLVNIAFEFFSS